MAQYAIGKSSFGDLKGVTQYVNSQRIAQQFLSMALDYKAKFGKNGDRLTPNEGLRSRPRQQLLYRNFLNTGYPVAAVPYTSRHDANTHGNAVDVGVTMANGNNRALTSAEFAWMHEQAERRGFTWTGRYFNEPWHIEGATRAEIVPPYSAAQLADTGKPNTSPAAPAAADLPEEEDDMKIIRNGAKGTPGFGAYFAVSPGQIKYLNAAGLKRARQMAGITDKQDAHFNPGDLKTLTDLLGAYGIPSDAASHLWLLSNPSGDGKGLWTRSGASAKRVIDAIKESK